jgi:hypothetical protein
MWSVDKPNFDAGVVYSTCISRVKNVDLRQRLRSVLPSVVAAALDFEAHAQASSLHLIDEEDGVGDVTTAEMVKVYDARMAAKKSPGRAIYDQLKMLPEGDRCPFCDQRNISTLDHFLPKALFPRLVVSPCNLVGACMECNKIKKDFVPQTAEEVGLHPYYDDISTTTWLAAEVVEGDPCGFVFSVSAPRDWDELVTARANGQFRLLQLGTLYASEASRELANIRYNLRMHYDANGAEGVRDELLRQWRSRRNNRLNSWQTAMYRAISQSDWFCDGGFG